MGGESKNDADACKWVQSGSEGREWMHWQGCGQKQGKKRPRWVRRGCFVTHVHGAKNQEVGGDGYVGQRGSHGGIEGKQEVCRVIYMCISK